MTQSLPQALQNFSPALPLGVAFSGGADSSALLLACAQVWPGQVVALHVNHGLQTAASAFEAHCVALCAQWNLPLRIARVDARHHSGQSPEDAARQARYAALLALARQAPPVTSIALAQHADDQVETLLLALSRGAGVAGLSAMAQQWQREGMDFHRPLLPVSSATIRQWLTVQGVTHVEDPSNSDLRYTRNRIRAQLLPALQQVFPQFLDTFSRSAAHAAQAQALLDELAQVDLLKVQGAETGLLSIKALQGLKRLRQGNCLRYWLKLRFSVVPSTAQLEELLDQLAACTTRGHHIDIKLGTGFVRREGPLLNWYNP